MSGNAGASCCIFHGAAFRFGVEDKLGVLSRDNEGLGTLHRHRCAFSLLWGGLSGMRNDSASKAQLGHIIHIRIVC